MARPKGEFVKAAGTAFEIVKAIADDVASLGGTDDDIRLILKDRDLRKRVAETIMAGRLVVKERTTWTFSVWKTITITIGTGLRTANQFRQAIKKAGGEVSPWANDMLGKPAFTVATQETELDLVNVSGRELGFTSNATRSEIYARAIELGLELCPAEVGPQLRLQYRDQSLGEWLLVGMEPISDSRGNLNVFNVLRYEDGLWLNACSGHPDYVWGPGHRWAFVRPRK